MNYSRVAALIVVAAWAAHAVLAQEAEKRRADDENFARIVDNNFGFEISLPRSWPVDRQGFFGPADSRGVLRAQAPNGSVRLQILIVEKRPSQPFTGAQGREFEEREPRSWAEQFAEQLTTITGAKEVTFDRRRAGHRDAVMIEVEARVGADETRTFYYCVPFDDSKVWILAYAFVLDGRVGPSAARGEFNQIAESLTVLYDPVAAEKIADAVEVGELFIERLATVADDIKLDGKTRYYRIERDGKATGYVTRRLRRDRQSISGGGPTRAEDEGLRVDERSWQFNEDGTAIFSEINLFCTFDMRHEKIQVTQIVVPSESDANRPLVETKDQVVRVGDVLTSSFTSSTDLAFRAPRNPIRVGESYLSLAWVRFLPALLGTSEKPMHGFTIYDTDTRTLTKHLIRPVGKRALPGTMKDAPAYEVRQGFVKEPATLYTDDQGYMVRLHAGDFVLVETTEAAVEKQFGARKKEIDARARARAAGLR